MVNTKKEIVMNINFKIKKVIWSSTKLLILSCAFIANAMDLSLDRIKLGNINQSLSNLNKKFSTLPKITVTPIAPKKYGTTEIDDFFKTFMPTYFHNILPDYVNASDYGKVKKLIEKTEEKFNANKSKSIFSSKRGPLNRYKDIIDLALQREEQFKDTDYVFYYVQDYRLKIIQDLNLEICKLKAKCAADANFVFLRPFGKNYFNLPNISDPKAKDFIISTNLNLFGYSDMNLNMFKLFINPEVDKTFNFGKLANELLTPYIKNTPQKAHIVTVLSLLAQDTATDSRIDLGDPKDFMKSINVDQTIFTPEGLLIQIFIPKDKVSNLVTMTAEKGNILLRGEYFADPTSGIRIFSYSALDSSRAKAYQKRINIIAKYILDQAQQCPTGV